jgi:hypothetical protein
MKQLCPHRILLTGVLIFTSFIVAAQGPHKGIMVDAGGHRFHLNVMGSGSPAVIMENGSGDFSFIWSLVQPEIARFTKTVSYDRAGYAWSEPGPLPRTSAQIAFELHSFLIWLFVSLFYIYLSPLVLQLELS